MNNYKFNIARAKKVEAMVKDKLNIADRAAKYSLEADNYACWDIVGKKTDSHYELIEVKERRSNDWDTWFIEAKKIDGMFEKEAEAREKGFKADLYLAIVSENKITIYNIWDIIHYPTKIIKMNRTTAKGFNNQGEKVEKVVYQFPKTLKNTIIQF